MLWFCIAATLFFGTIAALLMPYELTFRGELVGLTSSGLALAFFFGILMELAW